MTSTATAKRAASRSGSRLLPLVAGVVVLVLVLAGGLAYRLSRDDGGTPSGGTSASQPSSGSGYQVQDGDEEKAVASFAAALVEEGELTEEQASCMAFQVIRTVGLQRMVDIGMFDEDMEFLNIDLADHPDVKDAISNAALTCVRPG